MAGTVNQTLPGKVDGGPAAPWRWLFALRCVVCGEAGAHGRDLCAACHSALPWQGPACLRCAAPLPQATTCGACLQRGGGPLQEVHAVFDYAFPLDRLLPRLKFHADFAVGRVLAHCMATRCAGLARPDALVPVPLHRGRLRWRGYDQALELARPLARALDLPLCADRLRRRRATAAQSELGARARRRNVRDAFALGPGALPDHIAVFDDVMTTGATLAECCRLLKSAGVARVDAWAIARAPAPDAAQPRA